MYFCRQCADGRSLNAINNLTEGCLFAAHKYTSPAAQHAVAAGHYCRLFEVRAMHAVCNSLSRPTDGSFDRGKNYAEQYFPWWCKGLPNDTAELL